MADLSPMKQPRPLSEIPSLHAISLGQLDKSTLPVAQGAQEPQPKSAAPTAQTGSAAVDQDFSHQQQPNGGAFMRSIPHHSEVPKEINAPGPDHPTGGPLMELDYARTHQTDSPPPVIPAEEQMPPRQPTVKPPPRRSGFFGRIVECFRPAALFGDTDATNEGPAAINEKLNASDVGSVAPHDAPLSHQTRNTTTGTGGPHDTPLEYQTRNATKETGGPHNAPLESQTYASQQSTDGLDNNNASTTQQSKNMVGKSGTSTGRRKWWLNSKTPREQLPQPWTWEAYYHALNNQDMDPNDPPETPGQARGLEHVPDSFVDDASLTTAPEEPSQSVEGGQPGDDLTPLQKKMMPAPNGFLDRYRQEAVHRLDVFGKRGPPTLASVKSSRTQSSDIHVTPEEQAVPVGDEDLEPTRPEEMSARTLEGHEQFKKLVRYARRAFGTALSMISVVDEDRLLYLAESGVGLSETPRDIKRYSTLHWQLLCGWTLLSSVEGFAINDTHKDWRFINNPLVTNYGARFYAGCPIFAPELYPGQEVQAVGTICVCDMVPREFSNEDRKKLMRLAVLVRREIATWHEERLAAKMRLLNTRLSSFHHRVGSISDSGRSKSSLAPSYEADPAELAAWGSDDLDSLDTDSSMSSDNVDSTPSLIFSLASKTIAKTLDLRLAYLIEVQFDPKDRDRATAMTLLSSYGLPNPPPLFDDKLHLNALRTPEGGLLYQNPMAGELAHGESLPKSDSDSSHYTSAILVRVLETERSGFVLAGFADANRATFGMEDLDFIRRIASEVKPFCRNQSPGLALPMPSATNMSA